MEEIILPHQDDFDIFDGEIEFTRFIWIYVCALDFFFRGNTMDIPPDSPSVNANVVSVPLRCPVHYNIPATIGTYAVGEIWNTA